MENTILQGENVLIQNTVWCQQSRFSWHQVACVLRQIIFNINIEMFVCLSQDDS